MIFREIVIASGGQSGVDRAALDFALKYGIKCKGWCPRGRLAEDGVIPFEYPLKETLSKNYSERTSLNVQENDGTLIILIDKPDFGTLTTIELTKSFNKPLLTISILNNKNNYKNLLQCWLSANSITTLNIAGPRESSSPGIYKVTFSVLESLLLE